MCVQTCRIEDYPGTAALCHNIGPASPEELTVTKIGEDDGFTVVFSNGIYTL